MTRKDVLDKLEKEGLLNLLAWAGLIDPNIPFQKEIYDLVKHKVDHGQPKMEVYEEYATNIKCSSNTIRGWIREMDKVVPYVEKETVKNS